MIRNVRVWYHIMRNIAPSMRLGRQADRLYRFYVLKTLDDDGLFKYLEEPRTYGHILAELGYADIEYTRGMLDILLADHEAVIAKEGNLYKRTALALPRLDEIVDQTPKRIRSFLLLAEGMSKNIPARLRNQPVELLDSFEQDGRQLLSKLDSLLGDRIYSSMRNAVFAFLTDEDQALLQGGTLLEVGCGSGRETAEVWLKTKGKAQITGIDAVQGVVELADHSFEDYLKQLNPAHPPVNSNRPVFKQASATHLPFEDNSFDAVMALWMLHWTADPPQAIHELVRVTRPGGLIFGAQALKPLANPYFDLVFRTSENVHGFFWKEDFMRWFGEDGLAPEMATPMGTFRVRKKG